MKERVILRELQKSDFPAVEDMIRKTWKYDAFADSKTAEKLAKAYLAACLAEHTYAKTAEVDGVLAGVILGKNREKHRCLFRNRLYQIRSVCGLVFSKGGLEILRFFQQVERIDEKLLKQCEKKYQGEVALFVVSQEHRGLGIGKKLFDSLMDYMKHEQIKTFFLYTDTTCNFGFYEHQGMVRRQNSKEVLWMKGQRVEVEFYLYDMMV